MKPYKGELTGRVYTGEQRLASLKLTKAAINRGEIEPASVCEWCEQSEGIIQYHNQEYSHPTKYLLSLCWRCHMVWHSRRWAAPQVKAYFKEIQEGGQYPPVYRHDFNILADDHGIGGPRRNRPKPAVNLSNWGVLF